MKTYQSLLEFRNNQLQNGEIVRLERVDGAPYGYMYFDSYDEVEVFMNDEQQNIYDYLCGQGARETAENTLLTACTVGLYERARAVMFHVCAGCLKNISVELFGKIAGAVCINGLCIKDCYFYKVLVDEFVRAGYIDANEY